MAETAAAIDIDLSEWRRMLAALKGKGERAQEILIAVFGTFGFKDIEDHFRNEEGPDGPWKRRAPSTQAMYAAIASGRRKAPLGIPPAAFNPSNKILQMQGFLRKSILPANFRKVGRDAVMLFSTVRWSKAHDEGSGKRRLPQRKFMWMSDDAMRDMAEAAVSMYGDV